MKGRRDGRPDARGREICDEAADCDPNVAERWCDAWEAEATLRDLKRNADYWDVGKLWIDAQCAERKRPPN